MSIVATHLGKSIGEPATRILSDINLTIAEGEFVALTGRSGSGKSTLLYLLSTLDSATEGSLQIDGKNLSGFSRDDISNFRNQKMGFIFQFHYLLSELTALENVLMPAKKHQQEAERRAYAIELLKKFGLADKINRFPRQLSGGEQQRVAIARALVMQPQYLFADEPTGSLDSISGANVMKILCDANAEGTTVVLVTHDVEFSKLAKRSIQLIDGRMV